LESARRRAGRQSSGIVARGFANLPQRTQITRHDCVEGWSAIGKWQGAPLALLPAARFVVFHCADLYERAADGTGQYYESIDLIDAFHPQTILAHRLNDVPLSAGQGAPLRLRVERQLGYKHAKYVIRIELTDRLDRFGRGKAGSDQTPRILAQTSDRQERDTWNCLKPTEAIL
jgi:DMSO/TMAO reductase YedYZ molybdopterin-dependent catalytic subunit